MNERPRRKRSRPTSQAAVDREPLPLSPRTGQLNELRLTLVRLHHGDHVKERWHPLNSEGWWHYDATFAELGERVLVVEIHDDDIKLIRNSQWPDGKKKGVPPLPVEVMLINQGGGTNLCLRSLSVSEALRQIVEAEVPDDGKL